MHPKAFGLLIALFVLFAAQSMGGALDDEEFTFNPGPGFVYAFTGLGIADTWIIKGLFQRNWTVQGLGIRIGAGCSYEYLGEFLFVDSQEAAFQSSLKEQGTELGGALFTGISIGHFDGGLVQHFYQTSITGIDYHYLEYRPVLMLQWREYATEFQLAGSIQDGRFELNSIVNLWMNISKIHIRSGVGLDYDLGPIIKGAFEIYSWEKDLKLGLVMRYGLQYEVYEAFTFDLTRRIGNWEYSIGFAPSFIENNKVSLTACYYFEEVSVATY